jgi:translocation and assembly module TamB
VVDGKLGWSGSTQASAVTGRLTVAKLMFAPGSDLADIVAQFSDETVSSEPSAFERNAKLNVVVQSGDNLNVSSSQLSIAGNVNLTAVGTLAQPVLLGRVALTGGEVFFLSKRFEIQNGTVVFTNSVRTEPVLNLYVTTVVEQYNITISMTGPLDRLQTSYSSDPGLPTADVINLLAFGQTTAEAASAATPASVGAESAVASAVSGQVASQVQKLAGISQLTFNPLAGNNSDPGAQIAVQQRVSGTILLTFTTNATSAQNQTVQVQYQPNKKVTVSVIRDEYGGYGMDVSFHKAF